MENLKPIKRIWTFSVFILYCGIVTAGAIPDDSLAQLPDVDAESEKKTEIINTSNQKTKNITEYYLTLGYVPNEKATTGTQPDNLSVQSNTRIDDIFFQALDKLQLGNTSQAQQLLQNVLSLEPKHKRARLLLGKLLVQSRKFTAAEQLIAPLLRDTDNYWQAWFWSGTAQLMMGKLDLAANSLDQALSIESERAAIWVQRAVVEQERGSASAALQLLAIAAELEPRNPQVLINVAYANETINATELAMSAYRRFLTYSNYNIQSQKLRPVVMAHLVELDKEQ